MLLFLFFLWQTNQHFLKTVTEQSMEIEQLQKQLRYFKMNFVILFIIIFLQGSDDAVIFPMSVFSSLLSFLYI